MNAHLALDMLVCGYPAAIRSGKHFAMVNVTDPSIAFIDESEGAERPILLLSACVQSYSDWARFSEDWYRTLHEAPSIGAFHMREARNRDGNFWGWDRIDIDRKIIALCEVIVRSNIHTVTCWVDRNEYKETVMAASPPDMRHPYFICFQAMVIFIARVQRALGLTTPVDYVFDEKGDTGEEALMWYSRIKQDASPEIRRFMGATPIFRNDEEMLPLQAADLVAWRRRRLIESKTPRDPELASTMRLDQLGGSEVHISRKWLESIARDHGRVSGVAESKGLPSVFQERKRAYRKHQRRENAKGKNG
jgi:hypothetical protein